MRTKLIILVLLALALLGCRTTKTVSTTDNVQTQVIRETVRDTVIVIEGDSSIFRAYFDCDSNYNVIMKQLQFEQGRQIQQNVVFKDKIIQVKAVVDSSAVYLHWKEKYEANTQTQKEFIEKEVQVKYVPKWIESLASLGGVVLALIIIYIAQKLYNIFKNMKPPNILSMA